MTQIAEVVTLFDRNFRDPASTLRAIADDIEAGRYGDVEEVAIAMNAADTVEVFATGPHSDAGTACLLFTAAIHRLVRPIIDR
jgi:hypothetical protein